MKISHFFLFFFIVFSVSSFGAKWEVNPDHSEIFFSAPYLKISEVTGRFKKFNGSLELSEKFIPTSVEMQIEVSSIDTGNKQRDGHLQANEFFFSKKNPLITFQSQKILSVKENQFIAHGALKIKDTTVTTKIHFSMTSPIQDTWNYSSRFVKFRSTIKRSHFGLNWNKTVFNKEYLVGDDISIWGTFQLQPFESKTPKNKHMIPDTPYIRYREKISRGELSAPLIEAPEMVKTSAGEKTLAPPMKEASVQKDFRHHYLWWISLGFIGFIGFLSMILISHRLKNRLVSLFPDQYRENSFLSQMIDFFLILLFALYSVAIWIIGWGVS